MDKRGTSKGLWKSVLATGHRIGAVRVSGVVRLRQFVVVRLRQFVVVPVVSEEIDQLDAVQFREAFICVGQAVFVGSGGAREVLTRVAQF
ncbi:hypothetical protein GCM10022376_11600 [Yimella lutea]